MKIVYIAGTGHSGSTLLDLLISGHDAVFSVGEAKRFNPDDAPTTNCSCRVQRVLDCPFWNRVGGLMEAASGISLRELDLVSDDDGRFLDHNIAFYAAVQQVTGKNVIVDSSKSPERLRRLLDTNCFDVLPIHLVRQPHGVVYSSVKKKRGWFAAAIGYSRNFARTRDALRGQHPFVVRYEDLARDPRALLEQLMPCIGLAFDARQLDWAGRERHNCGGNRMRRSSSSAIRLDEAWRRGLNPWQRAVVSLLTLRARP